jgi:hypothetical protein
MLVCVTPELVPWQPNFSSSGQSDPDWTRLVCGGIELSNAVSWVDWLEEPAVQVQLCESCGISGCESGGYVHVSRLGRYLLWTQPHIDASDAVEAYQYRASNAVREHGAVAISVDDWSQWRDRLTGLPRPEGFPTATRRDLLDAWQAEAPGFGRWDHPDQLLSLVREWAVAAEPSETGEALQCLEALVQWFRAEPDAAVEGELVLVGDGELTVETLYLDVPDTFDRPALLEWTALARHDGRVTPVFGGELVLVPEPT